MREGELWPSLREYWHPVAFADEVKEKPVTVRLLDERVAVCRLGDRVAAFYDLCIHRGCPISLGWIDGDQIVCAYHGWSYNAEGKCTRIPSVPPEHPIPKKATLTPYLAEEKYGLVWVCLSQKPRAPIPEFPEYDDSDFRMFFKQRKYWRCTAARAIENFVDLGHFAWVHEGILGDRSRPRTPDMEVTREGESLRFGYQNFADGLHGEAHTRNYRLSRPFTIYQWKVEEGGRREVYLFTVTPHSAKESTRYLIVGRNYDFDAPEVAQGPVWVNNEQIRLGDNPPGVEIPQYTQTLNLIADQDQVIVENQRPEELPLDLSEELHVKGPDAVALAYRRFLAELGVVDGPAPRRKAS